MSFPDCQLFKDYIELELKLREFDRCRTLYEKWLEVSIRLSNLPVTQTHDLTLYLL